MSHPYFYLRPKLLASFLVLLSLNLLTVCLGPETPPSQRVVSVGMALARGGLGDRSFNDSANAGLQRAQTELGVRFRVLEFDEDDQVANLRTLVEERHDLIIGVGQENAAPIKTVAEEFPEQRFAVLDASVDAPNVTSVTFRELEGDFLAGALAAMLSPNGAVGFLGGADIDIIRRIEFGWMQGVKYINPQATFLSEYAAGENDFSGFAKPELGEELATRMYEQGADIIYVAAGRTGLGAIEAAKQAGRLAITTSADQRWIAPQAVVTSRTKNLDVVIFTLLQELLAGGLEPGIRTFDLASGGVGLAPIDGSGLANNPSLVSPEVQQKMATIQRDLFDGKIALQEFSP
jgi:basic membrane protein A